MREKKLIILLIFLSAVAFKGYSQDLNIDNKVKEALIYPNPLIGDKFVVKSESNIIRVEVVNVIGKVINRTENKENFELHELQVYIGKCEKGMYFVKVSFDDNKSIIKKLLVK